MIKNTVRSDTNLVYLVFIKSNAQVTLSREMKCTSA